MWWCVTTRQHAGDDVTFFIFQNSFFPLKKKGVQFLPPPGKTNNIPLRIVHLNVLSFVSAACQTRMGCVYMCNGKNKAQSFRPHRIISPRKKKKKISTSIKSKKNSEARRKKKKKSDAATRYIYTTVRSAAAAAAALQRRERERERETRLYIFFCVFEWVHNGRCDGQQTSRTVPIGERIYKE